MEPLNSPGHANEASNTNAGGHEGGSGTSARNVGPTGGDTAASDPDGTQEEGADDKEEE